RSRSAPTPPFAPHAATSARHYQRSEQARRGIGDRTPSDPHDTGWCRYPAGAESLGGPESLGAPTVEVGAPRPSIVERYFAARAPLAGPHRPRPARAGAFFTAVLAVARVALVPRAAAVLRCAGTAAALVALVAFVAFVALAVFFADAAAALPFAADRPFADALGSLPAATSSLKVVPGRNAGTAVFFTFTVSPVRGLRAVRAARTRFSNTPNPVMETLSPLVTAFWTSARNASRAAVAAFLSPRRPESASISCVLFTPVLLPLGWGKLEIASTWDHAASQVNLWTVWTQAPQARNFANRKRSDPPRLSVAALKPPKRRSFRAVTAAIAGLGVKW